MVDFLTDTIINNGITDGDTVYLLLDISGGMQYPSGYLTAVQKLCDVPNLKLVVITCDDEVRNIGHFTAENLDTVGEFKINEGGPTYFQPALDFVLKDWKGSGPAKVFYVTDGHCADTPVIDSAKIEVVWVDDRSVCQNTSDFNNLPGTVV